MTELLTKPSTPRLSDVARKVVVPDGVVTTGWPQVRKTCAERLGIEFDPWQDQVGRLILAKRADGKLACMIGGVGMSLPRQVGKTYLVSAMIFAICVDRPGTLAIWSAHHGKTHAETFLALQALAKRTKVKPYIDVVYTGSGDEEIRFANGSRILFGARERGFGRGIPGVDVIMADEAQIMSDKALEAQLATLNTSDFGLALWVGTPPTPTDPSEAFTRMRDDAYAGTLEDALWVEFGADPGARGDDRKQWAKANPSYPRRTPAESVLRLQRKLKPEGFLREGLGVWDELGASVAFPAGAWAGCATGERPAVKPGALAVAVSFDLAHSAVAAAAWDVDGRLWLRPLKHGPGTEWVVGWVKAYQDEYGVDVVVDKRGPAAVLLPFLEAAGVRLKLADAAEVCDAYDRVYAAVRDGVARQPDTPELNAAVVGAVPRSVGDRSTWGRRVSTSDISLLEATTLAAGEAKLPVVAPVEVWGFMR